VSKVVEPDPRHPGPSSCPPIAALLCHRQRTRPTGCLRSASRRLCRQPELRPRAGRERLDEQHKNNEHDPLRGRLELGVRPRALTYRGTGSAVNA
jgi:hypothetical protein